MSHLRSRFAALLLLVVLAGPAAAGPPVFWVGAGPPCNFTQLTTAIGAVPDGAIVRLASNQGYEGINVGIVNKSLTIEGGWADCSGTESGEPVTLTGASGASMPVFEIGSPAVAREVVLRNLRIRGGERSGVELSGLVHLWIEQSVVDQNGASLGGGVHVDGVSPDDTVLTVADSVVGSPDEPVGPGNDASLNGGGVYCHGGAIVFDATAVRGNHTAGNGGGLALNQCAFSTGVGSHSTPELGSFSLLIDDNVADSDGGGVSAIFGSTLVLGPGFERIEIERNRASYGGGLALASVGTSAIGFGLALNGNVAAYNGGGAYVTNGAALTMTRATTVLPASDGYGPHGAVIVNYCVPPAECSHASDNQAENLNGAAFYVDSAALTLQHTALRGNVSDGRPTIMLNTGIGRIENVLIEGNETGGGELVRLSDGSSLAVNSSTIVGNDTGSLLFRLFSGNGANNVYLRNSILWQPGTTVMTATAIDTVTSECVNAHETVSIDAVDHDPGFRDAANADYRLRAGSENIDACDNPFTGSSLDLLGNARPVDLGPDHGNGDFDRGAYELPDRIFFYGFEVIPIVLALPDTEG